MKDFRPQQLRTINAILSKNDVLLVAPTGGGKSLCFQLPAILTPGLTVVISPLISLMDDQLVHLKNFRIEAAVLSTHTDKSEEKSIYNRLTNHDYANPLKLLYITPERMSKSKRFMTALQKCYLAKHLDRFAIDEVHCCSQWGHDFRKDYKFLGSLKTTFPDIPILGVTATATNKVIMDVQKILNIRHSLVIRAPFNRPNLYYQVMEKPTEIKATIELIANLLKTRYAGQSGIIYTHSIKDTEELSSALLNLDLKVRPYNANLDKDSRTRIHRKWIENKIQAVVATIAFGMGIDKSNVRFVIHHTIGKSMENFYQESGRAGRDGLPAECLLLYRFQDIFKISTMIFTEYTGLKNAYEMMRYCITGNRCRRDIISEHFSEVWEDTDCDKMCDYCYYCGDREKSDGPPKIHVSEYVKELQAVVTLAETLDMKLTAIKLIDAWYQKGPVPLRLKNTTPPQLDRSYAEQIVAYCLLEEFLAEDFHYTAYKTNSYFKVGGATVKGDETLRLNKIKYRDLPPVEEVLGKRMGEGGLMEECFVEVEDIRTAGTSSKSSTRVIAEKDVSETRNKKMKKTVVIPVEEDIEVQEPEVSLNTTNEMVDDDDEEIIFRPVKSTSFQKVKKKRIYDTSDDTTDEQSSRSSRRDEIKGKRKRQSSFVPDNLIIKEEIIIDDDIEIVDDKSVFIDLG